MSAKEYKDENAKQYAIQIAEYKKKNPDADISSFVNRDGCIFDGKHFLMNSYVGNFEPWTVGKYLKHFYSPFSKVAISAKDMEELFDIHGLEDAEASFLFQNFDRFHGDAIYREIAKRHPASASLPPYVMEGVLGITPTERKRWSEDGRLHVVAHVSVHLAGYESNNYGNATAPCYDYFQAVRLTPAALDKWRKWDKEKSAKARERKKNSKHTRDINAARKKKKTVQNANTMKATR